MRLFIATLGVLILASPVLGHPSTEKKDKKEKKEKKVKGVPPGLAKKGGLPPGLAKKFGARPPERAYIALDPRYDDRAWFLVGDRWVLQDHFDSTLRVEVRDAFVLPPVPPPIPLPPSIINVDIRVVVFH